MIRRPGTILALLTALNLLNYLDRFVLAAVLSPIMQELGLTHFWGGALVPVFLIGYFLTSPIFGVLADRGGRRGLIAFGIGVWSLATVASGLATGLWSMVVARAFVGVGEASYATIAPTIIDDVAPPAKRGTWLAIFYAASPIGSAIGYLVGGFVCARWGWRHAFYVAGGPGVVLAAVCMFLRDPPRTLLDKKPGIVDAFKTLAPIRLYRAAVLGFAAYTFAIGGFATWAPTFLHEYFALPLDVANFKFGLLTVAGGAVGTFLGGWLGDRNARRRVARLEAPPPPPAADAPYRKGDPPREPRVLTPDERDHESVLANLKVCALASGLGAPLALVCFLAQTPTMFWIGIFLCETALFLLTSPINAVILRSVPSHLRAGAMALSIFGIHLLGDLWSPALIGLLADILPGTERGRMQGAMMALPVAIAVSALVFGLGARNKTHNKTHS